MARKKSSTAPKNPTSPPARSAWAKGPPQATTAPFTRSESQSPVPSTPIHQTHSRRPSTLGQGIHIEDGVSIPRSKIGAIKQSSTVTFGSINDPSTPISSSPAVAAALEYEDDKPLETVPAPGYINCMASAPFPSSSAASTSPTVKQKIDIKKMFQSPSPDESGNQISETSSLSMGNSLLLSQSSPRLIPQSYPSTSQLVYSFTPFAPSNSVKPLQNKGPNGGPHRLPQYSRQMPNDSGRRSQDEQNVDADSLSSPRLGPHSRLSPPPIPSSALTPRFNAGSHSFVPRKKITLKNPDGTQVDLETFAAKNAAGAVLSTTTPSSPQGSAYIQGSPGMPEQRPARIRIESEEQRKKRLAEEAKEKKSARIKVEAEEKERKDKEVERKVKEAEEKEGQGDEIEKQPRIHREEEQQRLKLEEQQLRKGTEEREAQRVREEEERKEIKANAFAQKQQRFWERVQWEKAEHVRLRLKLEQDGTASIVSRSLTTARDIADINAVHYPEGIKSPLPELNRNAKDGKFRYNREFLLQFMSLCKEKPPILPFLEAFGIVSTDEHQMSRVRYSGRGRKGSGIGSPTLGSKGLGFSSAMFSGKSAVSFSTDNFATIDSDRHGYTLIEATMLVVKHVMSEPRWSEMYARLCRKIIEKISSKVQDSGIKNNEGKAIAGGQLFRKHLLNRCQDDFERDWVAKKNMARPAAAIDEAAKEVTDRAQEDGKADEEVAIYWDDSYYAAQNVKRQRLGLIKFMGDLFKLQMLTERIMHECVKKILAHINIPEEIEIESLWTLLTTVGEILDKPKARARVDVYFSRVKELMKKPNVNLRMQHMLLDLIELRERKWVSRTAIAALKALSESVERKRLVLQPRYKPEREARTTDLAIRKKIAKDTKEFFMVRNLDKAEAYFTTLPAQHHHKLVYSLVSKTLESEEENAQLVADLFARSTVKCSAAAFERGFIDIAELFEIFVINAPNAVRLFVLIIKSAKLDEEAVARIAASSPLDSDILPALLDFPYFAKDGAERKECLSDLPLASTAKPEIPNEDNKESDIAAIKYYVRSWVKRLKEYQRLETNTQAQEPAANYINFSVTDEEDGNVIAILNLYLIDNKERDELVK